MPKSAGFVRSVGPETYAPRSAMSVFDVLFLLVILWPASIVSPLITAIAMAAISVIALIAGLRGPMVKLGPYWVLAMLVFVQLALSLLRSDSFGVIFSQSNHLIQLLVLYPGFALLIVHARWQQLLRSKGTILALIAMIVTSTLYESLFVDNVDFSGDRLLSVHNISINVIALTVSFFLLDRSERYRMIFPMAFFVVFGLLVSYRITASLYYYFCGILFLLTFRSVTIKAICALLVLGPIVLYLAADKDTLAEFLKFDHNTYVRAEFMRGAFPTLLQNPVFGVGFDVPFRDTHFAYLTDHPLLRTDDQANLVSNHHSIFDTALRLGLLGAAALYYWVFVKPELGKGYSYRSIMMIALALGLGSNAWFENQHQIAQVTLIIALLNFGARAPVHEKFRHAKRD